MECLVNAQAKIDEDAGLTPGSVAASRAALVVHNYLGTSWLETLAMNVPTVCFYDPEFYRPRAEARPLLDALVRVGVLHYSGSEAAKFVNSLRGNPTAWWQSAEVQEARESFVARYANFSDNWLEAWTEEFERLLS
jgi:putative transferase (TIGR04331 family)